MIFILQHPQAEGERDAVLLCVRPVLRRVEIDDHGSIYVIHIVDASAQPTTR